MRFYDKLIRNSDLEKLLKPHHKAEGIQIGEYTSYEPELVCDLLRLTCKRVDKLISLDKKLHGSHTKYTKQLHAYRAFTFEEFSHLFNTHIKEEEFIHYEVFTQLRRKRGGIVFEKQRYYYTATYEYTKDDYVRLLCNEGFEPLLKYFLHDRMRVRPLLPDWALQRHVYLCGATGSGKSVLLTTLLYELQRAYANDSIVFLDPHGEVSEAVKRFRIHDPERIVYIDPFLEKGYTPTFNPFQLKDRSVQNITTVVEQNILAFETLLSREGGDFTEAMIDTLEKCLYFLLQRQQQTTLLDLVRLLGLEENLLAEAQAYNDFFSGFFPHKANKTRTGLEYRFSRFLNSPMMRDFLIGKNTIDLEACVNDNKIVVFNLAPFKEMTRETVGKLILATLKSIMFNRKKGGSKHTYLVVDEAQTFVSDSMDTILSQLRGFGLHFIFATQYIEQLGDQTTSVKKNTAIKIVTDESPNDLSSLIKVPKETTIGKYEFFLKVPYQPAIKFRSPSYLLGNPPEYFLSPAEESELDQRQVERYYRPLQIEHQEYPPVDTSLSLERAEESKQFDSSPSGGMKPPFAIHIDEEDGSVLCIR